MNIPMPAPLPALQDMRCGLIALVGLPNAGKSTLMNALVGEKIGIISNKPNTTRVTVRGVVTEGVNQMVFMDTPGLNRSSKAFDRRLVQQATGAAVEADILVLLCEVESGKGKNITGGLTTEMRQMAEEGKKRGQKVVILLTKIDKLKDKAQLLPTLTELNEWNADVIIPIAAIKATEGSSGKGSGVDRVIAELTKLLPEGMWLFPPEQTTDIPLPLRLAELTREQAMRQLHQEIPYNIGVITEGTDETVDPENGEPITIVNQQILVAKEQHKPMVLGKSGQMLQKIGTFSRLEMQKILGTRVRLELHVKVAERWLEREQWLREMGV
ncbi:MAG: GTPase Era [Pseudomonas fluorescens]|nr:MAG: GTPase Era [Pseudomonas fluorescens]